MVSLFFAASLLLSQTAQSAPPPQSPPVAGAPATQKPTVEQGPYELVDDLGIFVVVVHADKAATFDAAMARLRQVFTASTDKARKQQASGWRVLKSNEMPPAKPAGPADPADPAGKPPESGVLYFWLIDPVTKGASYDPIAILKELSPADVQPVYDQLQSAIISITRVGVKELLKMGGA